MPLLVLAGVPLPVYRRTKSFKLIIGGWDTIVVRSEDKRADLKTCWNKVINAADNADEEGVHIFAYHFRESEHNEFNETIYNRHRLVWLERSTLQIYGTQEFTAMIAAMIQFEIKWRSQLRPKDVRSVLVLPETSFLPHSEYEEAWKRSQHVYAGKDDISTITRLLERFLGAHYRNGVWVDRNDLIFAPGGARHGNANRAMRWKFTFLTPEAFHYDVRHNRKTPGFKIKNHEHYTHDFHEYTNVSCHGYIRGGR